jgi:hypothetical protein
MLYDFDDDGTCSTTEEMTVAQTRKVAKKSPARKAAKKAAKKTTRKKAAKKTTARKTTRKPGVTKKAAGKKKAAKKQATRKKVAAKKKATRKKTAQKKTTREKSRRPSAEAIGAQIDQRLDQLAEQITEVRDMAEKEFARQRHNLDDLFDVLKKEQDSLKAKLGEFVEEHGTLKDISDTVTATAKEIEERIRKAAGRSR